VALAHTSGTTSLLPGYTIAEEVYRDRRRIVYRGSRDRDGARVIVKTLLEGSGGTEAIGREYELIQSLDLDGVPRTIDLIRSGDHVALVLEDQGGPRLKTLIPPGGIDFATYFRLGCQLAEILEGLHHRRIIHKDMNPNHVLVAPQTGRLRLIDFSIASRMPAEHQELRHPSVLEGTIGYLSPEQTGRMNRDIDYRTDFYSLGVTFYELLTGRLPFDSGDPLEVIHGHIARTPPSPRDLRPEIPPPLSDMVMKLLAKAAEERYQSAARLKADLSKWQAEWNAGQDLSPVAPGRSDFGDRFLVPQRLYGRERQLAQLMTAFEQVGAGPSELVLVSGYSGVGKSSLIRELYKPLVGRRGYFIAGKFDQVLRVPYGALLQAFRELVQQLLTEDEEQVSAWRARLTEALGAGAPVLAEVVPEVTSILGPQPPAPALGPAETQNRFRLVFQSFLRALARRDHPLVIFLDDLQWADNATLNLLEPLLVGADIDSLLLIGAYRDNEVDAPHPLNRAIAELEAGGITVRRMPLDPLGLPDLVHLVRDTLHCGQEEAEPLAALVSRKTGGNPFFVGQFLKALREAGLLNFDYERERWTFEMDAIANAGMTDNVIDLMTRSIQRLPADTQRALTLAACIGNPFDQHTLAVVSEQSPDAAAADLREAIDEGLILPAARHYDAGEPRDTDGTPVGTAYAFLHDRVQQAAYALIPVEQRQMVHLTVGRLLRSRADAQQADERIFDLVHHLNLGRGLIADPAERLALARLNLTAAQKAKSATAHEAALGYLSAGLDLVGDELWSSDYDLAFALHLEAAECQYHCGNFAEAEQHFPLLLQRAASSLDRAKAYRLRSVQYENMSRYADALATARECLGLFGVSFPNGADDQQAALEAEIASIQSLLGGRSIASLVDLPVMTDPEIRMVMNILTDIWASTYILGKPVLARLISATMVRLSLVHGNVEESAYGYVTHAITVGPVRGDYKTAYEFGRVALRVNERFNDGRRRAKIHQQFHAHVNLWRQPMATCIPHAREACRSGLESGDFLYAAYGAATEAWPAMVATQDLARFVREYSQNLDLIQKLKAVAFADSLRIILNWARALQGRTRGLLSLSDEGIDENDYLERYRDNPFFTAIHAVSKLQLCYLFEEYGSALETTRTARVARQMSGTIWPVEFDFWNGLTLAANYTQGTEEERTARLQEMEDARRSLAILAENCPENFRCQALLLSAEIERVTGGPLVALELYEQAIEYAERTSMLQHQGLANWLFARFWLERSQARVAETFLGAARQAYARWGASAKVSDLDRRYGVIAGRAESDSLATASTAESAALAEGSSIDLVTVMKAARVLASEMELERLLEKLLSIAIENAGAERGGLVLEHDGAPRVHAQGSGDQVVVQVHDAPTLAETDALPVVIVNYVRRARESLVLADARSDDRYRHDPHVLSRQPRSVIATPLINQGRLLGVVYLENNLATGVFTPGRLALLQVVASQAAIAIQNAQLYSGLKREIADRVRMEAALRTISEGTAALTGIDFFRTVARLAATTLDTKYALVAEVVGGRKERVATLAFWQGDGFGDNVSYPLAGTPCEAVIAGEMCHHPRGIQALFPDDRDLSTLGAEGYLGVPLLGSSGDVVGHIALIHDRPLMPEPQDLAVLKIFASRAGTELERQRAEDALRESQLRYSTLAETVPEVLYTNLPDGSCDYVSQRFLDYTGMTSEAALGFGWTSSLHPMDLDRTLAMWDESLRTSSPFEAECRLRRKDGEYRWFKARSIPMRGQDETIVRWFGVCTDLDDSKRAEEALRAALTEVAQLRDRLQAENIYLLEEVKQQQGFEEIVGRSPVLQRVLRQVEQVAPTDTTVLITGETGTGKELIARAIHNLSARKDRPMVTVNCGAISAGLVESELFGHEKGAFTGAVNRKIGRFELATDGTIFLDEIGDLSLDLQVKLLRVLQEGELERVGGSRTIKVDVRVIAATHKNLDAAVAEGRFRADLFYRLNVFPIRTPALRERREDVPALVRYFVMKYASKMGKRIDTVPKSALDTLGSYAWPGNVRELANVLERSVIISRGTTLELGEWVTLPVQPIPVPRDSTSEDLTRHRIIEALEETGWRVSGPRGAAQLLGLKPTTLEARMKRLGITRPSTKSQSS
jgi:PAS domain S-box-containing protein